MLDGVYRTVNAAGRKVGRRSLVWGVLLAVFASLLDFIPLTDLLGYDFSFVLGLAAALAGVDIGHGALVRARRDRTLVEARPLALVFARALAAAGLVLITPLLLALANAVRVRNCNFAAGFGFFALLPLGTVIYAAPSGVIAGLVVASPRRGRLLAFALPVASIVWALARLYWDPPVFAFDPFGGYFPGPIYDEALRPSATLLLFRAACLTWIATAIVVALAAVGRGADVRRWRRGALAGAIPLAAASVAFYALGPALGYRVDRVALARELAETTTTPHFVLHTAPGTKTGAELALTVEDLEFRYQQLQDTLGVEPKLPITVWDFPDAAVKKALVGAGDTLYAKPWTREMFVQEHFPSRRLRHELAHVFAGAFGDPLFGVALAWRGPFPHPVLAMGLVEGLAEAADASDPAGDATIHQDAAAMIAAGLAPPLEAVVGAGFTRFAGPRAYTIAGSFCGFLLATRGADKLRALYQSAGNFTDVYREPLASLAREWREFLAKQPVSTSERAHASEEFRRPAIFNQVCARELAAEAQAVERIDPTRAVAILRATCRDDPSEPIYKLALARAEAAAGDVGAARNLLARLAIDAELTAPVRAQAEDLEASLAFDGRDFANAEAHERRVAELASTEADRRLAYAKLKGLSGAAAQTTLGRALLATDLRVPERDPVLTFFLLTEYARLHPAERLGPYLLGRQLLNRDAARALPLLTRACGDEDAAEPVTREPLPPDVQRECRRMVADAAYRIGDFSRARTALARLAADATEADRLRALDMRARVDWAAARRSGAVALAR
jgi:hypothetical protein